MPTTANLTSNELMPPPGDEVVAVIDAYPAITSVLVVHSETNSGILSPAAETSGEGYRIEMSLFESIKNLGNGFKEGVVKAMKSLTKVKTLSLPC